MIRNSENAVQLRIKITGQAGSGGSTLATNLERQLGKESMVRISGGKLRRAEAFLWQTYREDSIYDTVQISENEKWARFEKYFTDRYYGLGLVGILELLQPYFDHPSDNGVLNAFNQAQETFSPQATIWDIVTDSFLLQQTEQTTDNYIIESKLAVVLTLIEELSNYVDHNQAWALPAFNLYLTVDPSVAQARINQREKTPVSLEDVIARRSYDWNRYGTIYHHAQTHQPLTETDLQTGSYVIDTSHLDAEAVLTDALLYLLCQLHEMSYEQPGVAQTWIEQLTKLLQQPRLLDEGG